MRTPPPARAAAAALALHELHLPANAGRADRPGRRAGAVAVGARVAAARRAGRALRQGRPAVRRLGGGAGSDHTNVL